MTTAEDRLRDLAQRIRDAVRPHVAGSHTQVSVRCEPRGLRTTHARLSVRVSDWTTGARVTIEGHDTALAERECIEALRARLTQREAWLASQLAATRAAIEVLP